MIPDHHTVFRMNMATNRQIRIKNSMVKAGVSVRQLNREKQQPSQNCHYQQKYYRVFDFNGFQSSNSFILRPCLSQTTCQWFRYMYLKSLKADYTGIYWWVMEINVL